MSFGSKETVIQTGRERAEQLAFADGPFRGPTQQIMAQVAEVFAEEFGAVGKGLDDVERFRERQDSRQPQQKLLPNAMTGLKFG